MFQTEMYVRELLDYLQTVTIKNEFIATQMFNTWVREDYKDSLPMELHPYYRNITGDYILKDFTDLEIALGVIRSELTQSEYATKQAEVAAIATSYGLSTYSVIDGRSIPNRDIYTKYNQLVIINSMDNQTVIPLTKTLASNLSHLKTVTSYKIPNLNYYTLCDKFPNSTALIKAILYPIPNKILEDGTTVSPINVAINASNLAFLNSDLSILEEGERASLYECMVETLLYIKTRWSVSEFVYEDLYSVAHQSVIWNMLFLALNVQRIKNIKTYAAHSYHIWEYLKSHGFDNYKDVLTRQQTLFLYKNLRYLLKHKGTEKVLELLSYVLLNPWNIRLHNKILAQQPNDVFNNNPDYIDSTILTTNIISKRVGEDMFDKLKELTNSNVKRVSSYQDLLVALEQVAGKDSGTMISIAPTTQYETLKRVFDRERESQLEYQNEGLFEASTTVQSNAFSITPHNLLKTKLLEIVSPVNSRVFETLYARFVTQQILYRASTLSLKFAVSFMSPLSETFITLNAYEAIALLIYAIGKENGFDINQPMLRAYIKLAYKKNFPALPETFLSGSELKYTKAFLRPSSNAYSFSITGNTSVNGLYNPTSSPNIWISTAQDTVNSLVYKIDSYQLARNQLIINVINNLNNVWDPIQIKEFYRTGKVTRYIALAFKGIADPMPLVKEIVNKLFDSSGNLIQSKKTLKYNNANKRWEIYDVNDKLLVYSNNITYNVNNVFLSRIRWDYPKYWYTPNGNRSMLFIDKLFNTTIDKHYVLHSEMLSHPEDYTSVQDFSTNIHKQAENYISMFVEAGNTASHVLSDAIAELHTNRIVKEYVTLDLTNGKSYKEFFSNDEELSKLIANLNTSKEPKENYSKLANNILESLYPISSPLKADFDYVVNNRYKKLKELFISMCSYNVAFLDTENINVIPYTMKVNTVQQTSLNIKINYTTPTLMCDNVFNIKYNLHWNDMNSMIVSENVNVNVTIEQE